MSKRFTCSEKWDDPWFRKLPVKYKVFWEYIFTKCNLIGIWIVDLETASYFIGEEIIENEVFSFFNSKEKERISKISNGKWRINHFIDFQYGELTPNNNLHKSIIRMLKELEDSGANEGLISPTGKGNSNNKYKDKDKENMSHMQEFEKFWNVYPKKRSKGQAEKTFSKLKLDKQLMETILAAIDRAKISEDWQKENGKYIPYPATWLNAQGWKDEIICDVKKVIKKNESLAEKYERELKEDLNK